VIAALNGRGLVRPVSNLRLVIFPVGAVLAWLGLGADALAAPLGLFLALVVVHERGLARPEDRGAGGGEPGEGREHPCGEDPDLLGSDSLGELMRSAGLDR
jgi:hypothetical protein